MPTSTTVPASRAGRSLEVDARVPGDGDGLANGRPSRHRHGRDVVAPGLEAFEDERPRLVGARGGALAAATALGERVHHRVGHRLAAADHVAVETEARLENDLGRDLELAFGHDRLGGGAPRPAHDVAGAGHEVDRADGDPRELEAAVGGGAGGGEELLGTVGVDVDAGAQGLGKAGDRAREGWRPRPGRG